MYVIASAWCELDTRAGYMDEFHQLFFYLSAIYYNYPLCFNRKEKSLKNMVMLTLCFPGFLVPPNLNIDEFIYFGLGRYINMRLVDQVKYTE